MIGPHVHMGPIKNISDNPVFVGAYKLPKISLNANKFPDENEQYVSIFYFEKRVKIIIINCSV